MATNLETKCEKGKKNNHKKAPCSENEVKVTMNMNMTSVINARRKHDPVGPAFAAASSARKLDELPAHFGGC